MSKPNFFLSLTQISLLVIQGSRQTIFPKSTVAPEWTFLRAQAENLGAHIKSACNAIIHIFSPF